MGRGTRGWGDGGTWRGNMAGWRAPQQPDKTAGSTYFGLRRSVAARPGSELSYANDFNVGNAVKQLIWTGVFVHRLSLPNFLNFGMCLKKLFWVGFFLKWFVPRGLNFFSPNPTPVYGGPTPP